MTYQAAPQDRTGAATWTSQNCNGLQMRGMASTGTAVTTAWPANNDAYVIPFVVSTQAVFVGMFFVAGTSPGTANYDLGIYDDNFALLASLGATAAVNTTGAIQPVGGGTFATPVTLTRGRYYMAMSAAATTITVSSVPMVNQANRAIGVFKMAAAHPLPVTFVPASMGTSTLFPVIGMTTVANAVL